MTDKKSNDSRRKLLKSIAVGSGAVVAGKSIPESWSKPVVDSILLPAHASTTEDPPKSCGPFCSNLGGGQFVELTISGTTVNIRLCNDSNDLQETTGSGQLNSGSFKFQMDTSGWVSGDIGNDCLSATVQFCAFESDSVCTEVFQLSPGSCGVCGG